MGKRKMVALIVLLCASCNVRQKLDIQKKARIDADYIIENLDQDLVVAHFPEDNFPRYKSEELINKIKNSCGWNNRRGNFVDYATFEYNGNSNIAFIYEFILQCDSLRFILIYNINGKEPKFLKLNIEPLVRQNPLIVHKEKQLLKYDDLERHN